MTIGVGVENPDRPGVFYRLVGDALAIRWAVKNVIGDLERVAR